MNGKLEKLSCISEQLEVDVIVNNNNSNIIEESSSLDFDFFQICK